MSDSGMTQPAVHTHQLTKRFGTFEAVHALNISIPYGQISGMLGPNGAGKSTTIKMLTTLLDPTEGSATVAGFDIRTHPVEVRRRIGYVPQLLSADGALTAFENMMLSARLYGMPRRESQDRINEALRFMKLENQAHQPTRTFSGGMIRRLEIAQSLLHRPTVLFLDEPTIGLDPVARHMVWDRLKQLQDELGLTVLMTTHDMEEAEALCDTLILVHKGKSICGKPAELKSAVRPGATLNDVFVHFCGGTLQEEGGFKSVRETRRNVQLRG